MILVISVYKKGLKNKVTLIHAFLRSVFHLPIPFRSYETLVLFPQKIRVRSMKFNLLLRTFYRFLDLKKSGTTPKILKVRLSVLG